VSSWADAAIRQKLVSKLAVSGELLRGTLFDYSNHPAKTAGELIA
jgi:hypothetical protein